MWSLRVLAVGLHGRQSALQKPEVNQESLRIPRAPIWFRPPTPVSGSHRASSLPWPLVTPTDTHTDTHTDTSPALGAWGLRVHCPLRSAR